MAAGSTYTPIATTTLGSATNSVSFSSISGSYTDLILIINSSQSSNGGNPRLQLNGDGGSNYSQTALYGTGSAAGSYQFANFPHVYFGGGGGTANNQTNTIINFQNYSNTTTNKTFLIRYNDTTDAVFVDVALYRSTSAITSIQITTQVGNFNTGSSFTLYGIASA